MPSSKEQEIEDLPDDAEEAAPKGKAKPAKAKPKKSQADEDKDARAEKRTRRDADPNERRIPYPASPDDVPEGLTDYAESYVKQQNFLLAGLFVFLMFYIGAVLFFALVGVWCVWSLAAWFPLKVVGIVMCGFFFLYLVKGFFKSHPMNKEMHIEITEDEHPVLFQFIEQLCDELGAPLPNKVFVSPDVNAAVMPRTSLINLFVEPKKDLLIGLGLVNSVNLSEFKAVLAHEFGHFSQSAMASSYTYVASRIIGDLVEGEDWFDRVLDWCKKQDNAIAIFGHVVNAPLWVARKVLEQCYRIITLQRLAVSREREFHADLVAVSAAGSNAVVHCLLRTDFGHQCFMQALNDLSTAMDHKLYSNDLYLHQDRASAVVRRKKKEPELGLPPAFKAPHEGKNVEVFDADEEAMTDEIPPMWRTHPSNSDREKNAKEQFVPAVVDHRCPWVLFDSPADLRERMTYKFYRMVFRVPKNTDLSDAVKVQKFIDNEHADTTYDPKYKGAYDDRPLEPGELSELNAIVRDKPWDDERMEKVLTKLYDGCEEHAEAHSELYKEMQSLKSGIVGRPSPKMKRKMDEVEKKQDENWEWFKSFDRRVYLLHVQMAKQVAADDKDELVERYRFQLEVQRLYQESRAAFQKADAYLSAFAAASRGEIQVGPDFNGEVIQVLREQWKALKTIIKDARDITLPAMKNFEENENLADFILEGKMVPEPPLSYVKGAWIDKLMTQLQGVRLKCFRLHFKSVGGILALQEKIAAKWKAAREPVAAEVIDAEPIAAEEVIAAEVIPASEVIGAEVVAAEVIDAEPVAAELVVAAEVVLSDEAPDEPIAAEVVAEETPPPATLPSVPAGIVDSVARDSHAPSEPSRAMAAFVATAAAASAPELHSPPVNPTPEPEPEVAAEVVAEAPPVEAQAAEAPRAEEPAAEAVFVLDAEPTPVVQRPEPPKPAPPVAADDVFSLDADAAATEPQPDAPPVVAAEVAPPKAAAELPETFDLGFGNAPQPVIKPANGKRPALRITLVKPGEKSPLTK